MELELAADPDAAGPLSRLKALTSCRDGRARTQAVTIVWHDNPEHALLAAGQVLAEQRAAWRLERLFPGRDTWLPAQAPPVVQDAPDLATLPNPLAPIAAFEGRRTTSVHRFGDDTVTLTVDKGSLRAVTSERAVTRIRLSGESPAVLDAARVIAAAVPVWVPITSLAAEAIAMAIGQAPEPRHTGAPVLPDAAAGLSGALAHILGHLTDVILFYAPLAEDTEARGVEAVHQMRVAVRRGRSALSIFRPALQVGALDRVNEQLKALGQQLGPTRDWDVFAEETVPAIQALMPDDKRLERLIAAAVRQRRDCRKTLMQYLASAEFRLLGIELAWFAATLTDMAHEAEPVVSLPEFAGAVLQHRWKKLASAGKRIDTLDIPSLHDVRLRAKRERYAAEMFSALYPNKASHRFIQRLSVLQQRLGVLNDGAVATHLLAELGGPGGRHAYATGVVAGYLAGRSAKIRPRIIRAYERFRRQPVYWA